MMAAVLGIDLAAGVDPELLEGSGDIEVWPENHLAWSIFTRFDDQWRMSMGGPISLDIVPIQHELARLGLTGDEYDDTFACVRIAANAALEEILRKKD